jgi:hypothetical protein
MKKMCKRYEEYKSKKDFLKAEEYKSKKDFLKAKSLPAHARFGI